ncbi:hypothetical protein yc1106_08143 [Curvularia clavata]|uniref:Uncharacterized protein n=1 Tax=Curvularia clavata TaxID=95742 RepID=A0A9Q8ZG65_CURCL|nr:hypothetical protein yc1106_08143 [Curvularia clavata]
MLDIAQAALHNDLFIAVGIGFFLNLPFVRHYWKPATSSNSLPEQPHNTPCSEAPITRTVTVVPEPVTLSQIQTVYDTVTKSVTSISTVVKQVVTQRRCLPTDATAPRAAFIEHSEAYALPTQTCTPCPPCAPLLSSEAACPIISGCPEAGCAPCKPCEPCAPFSSAESVPSIISASPVVWTAWNLLYLIVVALGATFLVFRLDLVSKKVAKAEGKATNARLALEMEKKSHQEWKNKASEYSAALQTYEQEVQDLLEGVAKRNDMLEHLGVFPDGDYFVSEEILSQKVRERKAHLVNIAEQMRQIEAEKAAQSRKIRELEAEITSAKEHVKNPRGEMSKPDKFQELLDEKQREINIWRKAVLGNDINATVNELHQRCEEKDAELKQLRILPTEVQELKQALSDAATQIETLQQEKKDQGIADRQRWIEEKKALRKEHDVAIEKRAKVIKALKAELKEAQQSSTSSNSAPTKKVTKTQPKDGEDVAANKQLLVGLEAEQNTLAAETMSIQSQHAMNEKFSGVSQALKKAEKECDQYKVALNDLKSNHGAENKQLVEAFKAEKEALAMDKLNVWQDMSERSSKVVQESEQVTKERDELEKDYNNLKDDCYELDQDLEDLECEDTIETMQHYTDLKVDYNAIAMENMTLRKQMYDSKEISSEASQNPQKVEREDDEL